MNYTLNQLRIFLKVAEAKSVTKAAEELHLTQPAVSIQLQNFQKQFDIPLTEVISRKLYVTDFGREIAFIAEEILNQVSALDFKSKAYQGILTGRLKISVVSTGKYVMPYFLSDFMKMHPGIELLMDVTNKNKVIKSLKNNEVDMSLVSVPPKTIAVDRLDLMKNELYLVGAEKPIKKTPADPATVFDNLPFIFRELGSGTRQTTENYFDKQQLKVTKKMELTSNEAVKQAVIAGLGYSILPLIGAKKEIASGDLHILPVRGLPITTTWSLIWLKGKKHTPAAEALLSFLKKEKSKIMGQWFN